MFSRLVAHQPIRKTISAIHITILSMHTVAPLTSEVNQSRLASTSIFVTSSTPVCSMVDSIRLGSLTPEWATSACAVHKSIPAPLGICRLSVWLPPGTGHACTSQWHSECTTRSPARTNCFRSGSCRYLQEDTTTTG